MKSNKFLIKFFSQYIFLRISLGAKHDGLDNDCLASDNFIMTSTAGKYTNPKNRSDYYVLFSTCSKSSIKNLIFPSASQNKK